MASPISNVIQGNMRLKGFVAARGVAAFLVFCSITAAIPTEEDTLRCSWQPDGDCPHLSGRTAESLLQVRKSDPSADAAAKPTVASELSMLTRDLTPAELEELAAKLESKPAVSASFPTPTIQPIARSISLANSATMISGSMAGQESGLGAHVPLSEAGYLTVLKERTNGEMETFLRRAIDDLGLDLLDEQALRREVPWYSGEAGSASFGEFKGKVLNALGQEGAWVMESMRKHVGSWAPVTNEGYMEVAKLKSNEEMVLFVEKVIHDMGFTVVNAGGIRGLVPFYSGEQQVQNLSSLKLEILRAALTPGSWVQAKKNS
jgi:hypothetical protein